MWAALVCGLLLVACQPKAEVPTLTVLAGSELKDLEPLLPDIEKNAGVKLNMQYGGTLDGTEKLLAGDKADLAWFSHAKYLELQQGLKGKVIANEKTMLSPVVLGVRRSRAQAWGWIDNPNITWRDIAGKAQSGQLKFGMANPAASNSGFTALIGVVAALSGRGDAITAKDVRAPELKGFFKGQALTAGSSGWLADAYVKEQTRLDGLINYESVLLSLNESGKLQEQLALIYPKEGIVTADYPVLLLNSAQRPAYDKLTAYLRGPEFQKAMMERTLRRPVNAGVALDPRIPKALLIELPFPNSKDVIDQVLFAYLDENRRPAHAVFVLDTSGSMRGDRMDGLKTALLGLTGSDASLSGQFARFGARERVTLIPFSGEVGQVQNFQLASRASSAPTLQAIRQSVGTLQADGGTGIYSALKSAYQQVQQDQVKEPDRYYSVVLMTDGENNAGLSKNQFLDYYRTLPAPVRAAKTFTVLFGEGNQDDMNAIAEATGGRVFDGRNKSLASIFKEIRGYQ